MCPFYCLYVGSAIVIYEEKDLPWKLKRGNNYQQLKAIILAKVSYLKKCFFFVCFFVIFPSLSDGIISTRRGLQNVDVSC